MIEQINKLAEIWWNWMGPMFWQVSILICLIAIIDFFLRKYIWPQVRYALWLLVLVKLILPPSFALPTGVVSYIQPLFESPIRQSVTTDGSVTSEYFDENMNFCALSKSDLTQSSMHTELAESTEGAGSVGQIEPSNETVMRAKLILSWHSIAMIGWLLITFLLMLRLFVRHHMLWQVHCEQECDLGLPKWLPKLINETAKKINLKQTPQLVLSSTIRCPAVLGIFKPMLLIPAEKINIMSRDDVENILLHEMTHIKHRDLLLHTLCVLLQIVYWFNPLLILVRRQLQHLRELCCDAKIAEILRDKTEAYSQTILQTVEWLVTRPRYHGIGLLGLIEDPSRLRVRLKYLKKKPSRHPNLRKATAFILVLATFVFILPMARAEKTTGEEKSITSEDKKQSATSLHEAAADGDIEKVKLLISKGADVNDRDRAGRTPLHSAAYEGHADIVKFLVDHGADVNAKEKRSQHTPLHRAAIKGNVQTVEILIANGADVNADAHGATPLFEAMKSSAVGRKEIVELLVAKGAKIPTLHLAAYRGDMETLKKCLQDGVDINSQEDIGSTALHIAASSGKKDIVEFLINKGAQPDAKDKWWWTPLLYAASNNHEDIADLLLAKGATVEATDEKGYTLLHHAIWKQDKNAIKLLIDKQADVNIQDEGGYTPLVWAIWMDDKELVEPLISKGADVNTEDKEGYTPIYWASMMGNKDIVELLIAKGASPVDTFHLAAATGDLDKVKRFIKDGTDVNVKDKMGLTALQLSIIQNQKDVAEFLINNGADINTKNQQGQTLLHQTCLRGDKDMAEFLISKGADIEAKNKSGNTPLHQACSRGSKDMIEFLISKGADIEAKNKWDMTPLHVAAQNGQVEATKLLLDKGADIEIGHRWGLRALEIAVMQEHLEVVKLLIARGTDVHAHLRYGGTALHTAAKKGNEDMVELLLANGADINARHREMTVVHTAMSSDQKEMVKFLTTKVLNVPSIHLAAYFGDLDKVKSCIAEGRDVNAKDISSFTPLHCAVFGGHKDVVKFLVDAEANVNQKDAFGRTALELATPKGKDLVELLVARGADVNIKDGIGETPLHWAVNLRNRELVQLLVAHGANVNAKATTSPTWEGWTPFHVACRNGNKDIIQILIAHGADINARTEKGDTAFSLAKKEYESEEDPVYKEVMELLQKHGAKE